MRKERNPKQAQAARESPASPWRFPIRRQSQGRTEFKLFERDRKGGIFSGGGSVEVEVFLGGAWHWMKFATDGAGYRKLSALSEPSRACLLSSLVCAPVQARLLPATGKKRARGLSQRDAAFWHNVDYWSPGLQAWAVAVFAQKKRPAQLVRVLTAAKKANLRTGTTDETAAALCVMAWTAIHTVNPERFPLPAGRNIQSRVTARISAKTSQYHDPRLWPSMREFISAVLRPGEQVQSLRRDVPVLSPPEEFGPSVFMADFRGC